MPVAFSGAIPRALLNTQAKRALEGTIEATVQPHWALSLPGETPEFEVRLNRLAEKERGGDCVLPQLEMEKAFVR